MNCVEVLFSFFWKATNLPLDDWIEQSGILSHSGSYLRKLEGNEGSILALEFLGSN